MTNVLLEKKGNIAVATINRPKALNALNSAVVADLDEMIGQIMADRGDPVRWSSPAAGRRPLWPAPTSVR